MKNPTPHAIILSFLLTVTEYTHLGAEIFDKWIVKQETPLEDVSRAALVTAMWLVVVWILPLGCKGILAIYELAGRVGDTCRSWARAKAVEIAKLWLKRLDQ